MTRAEYEQKYGTKPVFSSSTLDIKPAPIRMTRAEYEGLYGALPEKTPGLGSKLLDRGKDVVSALGENPMRAPVRIAGAVTGAANDIIGAAVTPLIQKTVDTISNIPFIQRIAINKGVSKGLDVANKGVEAIEAGWQSFEGANPNIAQDIRDITNILSFATASKGAQVAKEATVGTKVGETLANALDERVISKRVSELENIEGKYQATRKANAFADDAGVQSRRRIASTDVLVDSVDETGTLRTKTPGGAIDQYRAQTIDGFEDVVRKNLEQTKETIPFTDVRKYLVREIGKSGLEGGDLVTALRGVERELQGLALRTKGSSIIDLKYLHDAKIGTTRNINYMTPPETATYRKAVARAYKKIVEEKSTKFNVKEVNQELSKYYDDISRLERLDGRKVEGGRLGKYFAQTTGTIVGMGAGSVGGPIGSAVGGMLGSEAAGLIKGKSMASTFGGKTGKTAPVNPVLQQAKLRIPDKSVKVPPSVKKTKEMETLEKDIDKNVAQQKKAIEKGDFTLVAALKEVFTELVEQLKDLVRASRKASEGETQSKEK